MTKGKETKPHIGIFGRRNNGKSSLINALAGQEIAIVSDFAGTTTDPVKKSMEISGIGPVVLVDTAGIDDEGELGTKRVAATMKVLPGIDFAILVLANNIFDETEKRLVERFAEKEIPFCLVHNKVDVEPTANHYVQRLKEEMGKVVLSFSARTGEGVAGLVETLRNGIPESAYKSKSLLGDILKKGDVVMLITPIDIGAPEGRLILPQVQAIRDILDNDCIVVVLKETAFDKSSSKTFGDSMLPVGLKPDLVITDSQIFSKADALIPCNIPLTSFSIMLARHKGDFEAYLEGTPALSNLKDGDKVLILESCTHHVSCEDIGRTKIPAWLRKHTGKQLEFEVVAGLSNLPVDIRQYAIVIQCGGCVLTRRQLASRLAPAIEAGVPVTNYGMAIAWMQGIFERAVEPFRNG